MNEERHEMHRVQKFNTGAEEWECHECGRRFIILLEPNFQKVILKKGNENVIHYGGSAELSLGVTQDSETTGVEEIDEATLEPVQRWLDTIDFENLWK